MTQAAQASNRIILLDLLRGGCLAVIIIDHMLRFPSLFEIFTGRGILWVSAAEAFFFLSGAVLMIVRGRQAASRGIASAWRSTYTRALQLYIAHVILSLTFVVAGRFFEPTQRIPGGLDSDSPLLEVVYRISTLQYAYGWADFLAYYVVFLLVAPLALALLLRGRWPLVLTGTVGVWVLSSVISFGYWNGFLKWQAFFFCGMVAGAVRGDIRSWFHTLSATARQRIRTTAIVTSFSIIIASFVYTFIPMLMRDYGIAQFTGLLAVLNTPAEIIRLQGQVIDPLLQANRTGILRLPIFMLWFGGIYFLAKRYYRPIKRWIGWLLLPLGRNSLYVYIAQSLLVFSIALLPIPNQLVINTVMNAVALMLIWLLVRYRVGFKFIPR